MIYKDTPLPDVVLVQLEERRDDRGFFARVFCEKEFAKNDLKNRWAQINNSLSVQKGTIRGLHYQNPPAAEVKLVRCIRGSIFDVAVDLRAGSPTFGQWHGEVLTAENRHMFYVPEGFAHGFQALENNSEIIYFNTAPYTPSLERGVRFDDPEISIAWPLPAAFVSQRDAGLPKLSDIPPIKLG